jgi:type VI secretion system protein ImpF
MAELTPAERLQPALLDRLTDDEPEIKLESREARLISRSRLRKGVLRDLAWLFNATRMAEERDWSFAPYARRSVINYGLPALSGETASTFDVMQLEQAIRQAIIDFEPRLDPSTLRIEALVSQIALDHHNQIQVQIRGNLWAQPVPIELLLRTDVDLETGQVDIEDLGR